MIVVKDAISEGICRTCYTHLTREGGSKISVIAKDREDTTTVMNIHHETIIMEDNTPLIK